MNKASNPIIKPAEFKKRRKQLLKAIGKGSAAILPAAPQLIRNNDAEYAYRQESSFYYLTGFNEPEAVLVLIPGRQNEYVLFCRDRDPAMEIWTGKRSGQEGVVAEYGVDEAFSISDIDQELPGLLEGVRSVHTAIGQDADFDQQLFSWVNQLRQQGRRGKQAPVEFIDLGLLLNEMRLFKSRSEISAMRRAAKISADAHMHAMRHTRAGAMEYEIQAETECCFRKSGCVPSYSSIVGGGENACVLHYVDNTSELNDGELLLMDAGAEFELYAADITRTWPIDGKFNEQQKILYTIVLNAQLAAIKQVRPGKSWNAAHKAAARVITKGLIGAGLLKGQVDKLIKAEAYKKFFMHGTGHWLGMDVHDVGQYKINGKWRPLEPGMVLTVEPGLYIPPGTKGVAKKWWNIGIRIEDDVLVTEDGCDVLTKGVVKDIDAIETLVGSAYKL